MLGSLKRTSFTQQMDIRNTIFAFILRHYWSSILFNQHDNTNIKRGNFDKQNLFIIIHIDRYPLLSIGEKNIFSHVYRDESHPRIKFLTCSRLSRLTVWKDSATQSLFPANIGHRRHRAAIMRRAINSRERSEPPT